MKLCLQHYLSTVRGIQRWLGSKLRKVSSRCGRRKALTPIRHTSNLPSSSNKKNWYIWEKEALTEIRVISPSGQEILTFILIIVWMLCISDLKILLPWEKKLKGGICCIQIRQLQHRATPEVSKIFLKFKIYSNEQFMFCWKRPDLLRATSVNQSVCEPKDTTHASSWFITLNPCRHNPPGNNKINTVQANRRNKTMKTPSNTLEIFFPIFSYFVSWWRFGEINLCSTHNLHNIIIRKWKKIIL